MINAYVENLGFKSCVEGQARFGRFEINSEKKRFLFIPSGGFGVKRGKTKMGQIFYPPKEYWQALCYQKQLADVIFIFITYENFHPWSINGRKRKGKESKAVLPNWWEHSGLLVIEKNEKWKYYDCQLYDGIKLKGHFAYKAIMTSIRRKVRQVFGFEKVGITVKKFTQHVGIENACTAPLLYTIEAHVKDWVRDPFQSDNSMQCYLDKVRKVLERNGFTGMWGYWPWEIIAASIQYKKKLRKGKTELIM